ncbi:TIGR03943 family protein [Bacillus aerolatus]|uniref:TIGR03943 family protein n=1 Tax=Bacillus aerolatus TaxID=2653354 RepID=A0A6I1FUP2_9BACI|nr:TIGR03943 family protein [Bacillus aerolatus]KAB7708643.1 TIGR03943 family protein [Bacillus aerolatus]
MQFHFQQALRAVTLFAFFLFLIKLHLGEEITKYVNPKYVLFSQTAAVLFLCLFYVQIQRIWGKRHIHDHDCHHGCSHDHGESASPVKKMISYSILIFPLVTGFFLPAKTLDASIAAKKGTLLTKPVKAQEQIENESELSHLDESAAEVEPNLSLYENGEDGFDDQVPLPNPNEMADEEYKEKMKQLDNSTMIDMKDNVFEPYYGEINAEPHKYIGRTLKLKGFVYREEDFQPNQFVLARFLITHCVADANVIGFLTEFDKAHTVKENAWLEIEGTFHTTTYNNAEVPVLKIVSWKEISEPAEPYVYPVFTRIK